MDVERLGYRKALDGLRGVAVLAVLVYHLPLGVPNAGHTGVMMFFTLSGFLITSLLLEEHGMSGKVDLGAFYRRRALRLAPALVAVLAAIVVLDLVVGSQAGYVRPALFSLFYMANWAIIDGVDFHHINHTWSLAVEEHFYLLWPITVVLLLRLRARRAMLVIAVAGAVAVWGWRVWLWRTGASLPRVIYATDTRFDGLLIGCALAIIGWRWLGRWSIAAGSAAAVALIAVTAVPYEWFQFAVGYTAVPLATAVLIAASLSPPTGRPPPGHLPLGRNLLERRPLVSIGRMSYGLYLWHLPIYGFVFKYGAQLPRTAQIVAAVVVSICVAILSYRVIEAPFLRLKRPKHVPRVETEVRRILVP